MFGSNRHIMDMEVHVNKETLRIPAVCLRYG